MAEAFCPQLSIDRIAEFIADELLVSRSLVGNQVVFTPGISLVMPEIRGFIDAYFNFLRNQRLDGTQTESKN